MNTVDKTAPMADRIRRIGAHSNEPNLQNIPIRTPEGRRIREAFVAPPGHVIMSADYSQIELRIMAHISEDPALLRAFAEGIDVHRATAAEVFGAQPSAYFRAS
jgi:DNA polymerase-1